MPTPCLCAEGNIWEPRNREALPSPRNVTEDGGKHVAKVNSTCVVLRGESATRDENNYSRNFSVLPS
jgi:hypothetical protein